MATYAIGDIHGHCCVLERLLRRIDFSPQRDRLWLVGDMVGRGPDSLAVLRLLAAWKEQIVWVLGNHDVHLLGRLLKVRSAREDDRFEAILQAPQAQELLQWLRQQPLLHRENGWVLVHAGLLPSWNPRLAQELAQEAQSWLQGPYASLLLTRHMDASLPLSGASMISLQRARHTLATMTRLRTCTSNEEPCDKFAGPPHLAPVGCRPWYEWPSARDPQTTVLFGHWASLGLHLAPGVAALDSGCAWGRRLTALRLENGRIFQEEACQNLLALKPAQR